MTQAAINQSADTDIQYLREWQVLERFPFSRSQLWAQVKAGNFPAPVKLSERCSAWRMADLREYAKKIDAGINQNISERNSNNK